jgi:hypothetical protein
MPTKCERKLDRIAAQPEVTLERNVDAPICGRSGCRESTDLVRLLIHGFGRRVLCRRDVLELARREGVFDQEVAQ